jgi:hypothetical protein
VPHVGQSRLAAPTADCVLGLWVADREPEMSHASDPGRPADRPRLVCAYCGRTEVPAASAPARLPDSWWPKCCGQVMVYLAAGSPEPAGGTDPELRTLAFWTGGLNPKLTPQVTHPPARRPGAS